MIALIQRVKHAYVTVENLQISSIEQGLLVFIGIERDDTFQDADKLLKKLLAYRVFADQDDKMNLSVRDINGGLLLVPQFTLAANTHKGLRPSFTTSAAPEKAEKLFNYFCQQANQQYSHIATGQFGADMQVSLTNDGPVTFWLQTSTAITQGSI
jgi:D-tyrosyl-tRNA(Tyr) deacylase